MLPASLHNMSWSLLPETHTSNVCVDPGQHMSIGMRLLYNVWVLGRLLAFITCITNWINVFGVQATIDMEMEGKVMELKKEKDLLGRRHMDRDNALRKVSNLKSFLDSVVIGLLYIAHLNGCWHRFTFLPRLMPDPVRERQLLRGRLFLHDCEL